MAIADDAKGFSAIYAYDLATFKKGAILHSSNGYDIGGIKADRSGSKLAGIVRAEKAINTDWIDPAMRALQAEINGKVSGGKGKIISYSEDLSRSIVLFGAADAPGAYFLYDRPSGALKRLGYVNPSIAMAKLNPVRSVTYKARDGLPIQAVLTLPRGKNRNLPLIVLPHGGPSARDYEEWDWWTQFLAERGYAVIQPNYRGSSGLGTPFSEKGEGEWGLKMQDDLIDAIGFMAKEGIADPKRVCIAGASYGGYAAIRAAPARSSELPLRDQLRRRVRPRPAQPNAVRRPLRQARRAIGSRSRRPISAVFRRSMRRNRSPFPCCLSTVRATGAFRSATAGKWPPSCARRARRSPISSSPRLIISSPAPRIGSNSLKRWRPFSRSIIRRDAGRLREPIVHLPFSAVRR